MRQTPTATPPGTTHDIPLWRTPLEASQDMRRPLTATFPCRETGDTGYTPPTLHSGAPLLHPPPALHSGVPLLRFPPAFLSCVSLLRFSPAFPSCIPLLRFPPVPPSCVFLLRFPPAFPPPCAWPWTASSSDRGQKPPAGGQMETPI